jgi:hypothetical protein
MKIDYTPTPTGARFMQSDAPVRMMLGPVGSGKSVVCCMEVFRRCAEMPKSSDGFRRSRWVIVRNTADQLKKTTLKTWTTWFPDGIAGYWKESERTYYLEVGDIRAEILFLPLDTPDDQRRLLSLECTGVFINEAREVHPELIIAARSRMPRYPSKAMLPVDPVTGMKPEYWSGLILDTNPPSEDSWLYEQFETKQPAGWEIYKQPSGLSPEAENRENLGKTYYEDMSEGATEDFVRVHVHGEYGRSLIGRPVYEKTFHKEFHVAAEPLRHIDSPSYPIVIGMDFGRTPAAVFLQKNARGQILCLDSLYVENIGLEKFLRDYVKPLLYERFPGCTTVVIGDPAGWARSQLNEFSVADVFRDEGMTAKRASTNSPEARIKAVEHQLSVNIGGKPGLLIDPRCKHLIKGLYGGYKYKRKQNGSYDALPDKDEHSHDNDAFQYGVLGIDSAGTEMRNKYQAPERVDMGAWT